MPHKKTGFRKYWGERLLQQGLKTGQVIRCNYRVNPSDRTQGFASQEGLPADISIQVSIDWILRLWR